MKTTPRGFTLIEIMVVIGIVAILAAMAMPSLQAKIVRDQIIEAAKLADIAKGPIGVAWTATHTLPADNAGAGLPQADRIVSNWVSSVNVEAGAIHLTFGNAANGAIRGRTLTLRPAVVEDAPVVPVAWVCGFAAAPARMTLRGANRTDVARNYLPLNCM
jgi:type IV pilus assembly protein PilA